MSQGYKSLEVWVKAKDLAVRVYKKIGLGKVSRDFGLRDQLQRSAVSIASNIAEGDQRGSDKDGLRFFFIARGSLAELETQIIIAGEIEYLEKSVCDDLIKDCGDVVRMLNSIIRYRKSKIGVRGQALGDRE